MPETKPTKPSTKHLQPHNQEANQITRESLETALLFLLEKKELAKISVSELVQKAGVSRNAFYRNYQSKEQLLEEIFEKVVRRIFQSLKSSSKKRGTKAYWLALFQAAKQEAPLLKIAFQYNFEKPLSQMVSQFLSNKEKDDKDTDSYATSFWSSAIVAMLSKWISDGMKVSEEKMASLGIPLFQRKK